MCKTDLKMGSGDWFKTIISRKKGGSKKSIGSKNKSRSLKNISNSELASNSNYSLPKFDEDVAATMIQAAFRAYMGRKTVRRMKGIMRFQKLTERKSVKRQSANTLTCLHLWSKMQAEIRDRRLCMVIEGRLKQNKLENQLKLEAKLHDLEVEWNSGAETMDEILARIHQREEATVKRERAMAYAFNNQWRANYNQNQGPFSSDLENTNCGWSWKERWISAHPWEIRKQSTCLKKVQKKLTHMNSVPPKSTTLNGKTSGNARRLSLSIPVLKNQLFQN